MPTEEESVQYLYLVLTAGGPPVIEWDKVAADLDLKKDAAKKRWSRLKKAITDGTNPGEKAQQLLWLCHKHSARDKAPDWNEIAKKCGIPTAGAASKRYSRMKQAFDNGTAEMPGVATPSKGKAGASATDSKAGTPAPASAKRKHAPAKAKTDAGAEDDAGGDDQAAAEDSKPKAKRARVTKPKAKKDVEVKQEKGDGDEKDGVEPEVNVALHEKLEAAVREAQAKLEGADDEAAEFQDAMEQQEAEEQHERITEWLDDMV